VPASDQGTALVRLLIDGESDACKAAMATHESSALYRAPAITSYKMATYRPHASAYCSLALP